MYHFRLLAHLCHIEILLFSIVKAIFHFSTNYKNLHVLRYGRNKHDHMVIWLFCSVFREAGHPETRLYSILSVAPRHGRQPSALVYPLGIRCCDSCFFKLWRLLVMCTNPSARHCYCQRKIFTVETQQKFWLPDCITPYIHLLNMLYVVPGP